MFSISFQDKLIILIIFVRFMVRGSTEDNAVLCTDNATLEMKLREISNAMLVSPNVKTAHSLDAKAARSISQCQVIELLPFFKRTSLSTYHSLFVFLSIFIWICSNGQPTLLIVALDRYRPCTMLTWSCVPWCHAAREPSIS